jgi:acetoin utilization deacetylase AcuC-like enzyme
MPKTLRRLRHYVLNRLHPTQVDFVYSPEYQVDLGGSPIDVRRAERILTFLLSERLLSPKRLHRPHSASLQDLEIVHSAAYLESLRHPDALIEIVGTEVWPDLHQKALQAQRWAVGGTVLATQLALNRTGVAVNLGGGFHHAGIVSGKGFCIFNDVAIAVRKARQGGCTDPVLVIDLDLHDGNGTREIFARDPSVFTFSIHNQSWDQAPADASLAI